MCCNGLGRASMASFVAIALDQASSDQQARDEDGARDPEREKPQEPADDPIHPVSEVPDHGRDTEEDRHA